jgi:glyoxylase-like metal-dependent hydrolase (beta-lactamase superfamily II)
MDGTIRPRHDSFGPAAVKHREILPGLHRIWYPAIDNNAYLITGPGSTLIDSGPPGGRARTLSWLHANGVSPTELRHVAVTHCHTDHTGNLGTVTARATGAVVYGHAADAEIVRTGAERPRGAPHGMVGRIMSALAGGSSRAEPAPVHVEVADGDEIPAAGGLTCIHTPGHTSGHVSFLWPRAGVLFVGDAAANMLRWLDVAPLNDDVGQARDSFRKLAGLQFRVACFGHGPPIVHDAAGRFRRRLQRVADG